MKNPILMDIGVVRLYTCKNFLKSKNIKYKIMCIERTKIVGAYKK